ncbi:MAG: DUF92 domain-containing protein [Acidobacteriota bacterium]
MPSLRREVARKALHMAMGLFALCLRVLSPFQAALCALFALLHNVYLFPLYGRKKLERPEESARGYTGMVGYPAVVLVLILLGWLSAYPETAGLPASAQEQAALHARFGLAVAAAAWGILAFGDAFGALCGLLLKGPALPWNPRKTWAGSLGFVLAGTLSSFLLLRFVLAGRASPPGGAALAWALCLLASFAAAVVESLPGQFDDNLTVPLAAWAVLSFLPHGVPLLQSASFVHQTLGRGGDAPWAAALAGLLALHTLLSALAFRAGWVDGNGFLLGFATGLSIALALGPRGYAFLLLFYLLAHGSTYFGKATKERRGIAEGDGGRRGAPSVFSKGFAPALYAWLSPTAFGAALAVYAADTVATEFGKASRGRTYSLLQRREVPAGTPGGVSLPGSAAGLAALALMAAAFGLLLGPAGRLGGGAFLARAEARTGGAFLPLALFAASAAWFFLESALNEWDQRRAFFSKVVIHVMVGLFAGASVEAPRALAGLLLGPPALWGSP